MSCGGTFDNRAGHYESIIFVHAFPVLSKVSLSLRRRIAPPYPVTP
jgi:hypothetical protein